MTLPAGVRHGSTVEVLLKGEWVGGFSIRRVNGATVGVVDLAEGLFSKLTYFYHHDVRLPELEDPFFREGGFIVGRRKPL